MTEALVWEDYLTIGIYFAIVLAVGLWSTFRSNRGNVKGYFLAGKSMHWIPVGASIYASNIGAPMFIGLAGTGAASGIAVTIYEWHAIFCLIALGWLYMPVYTACGAFTMPEYIRMRYGGKRLRIYYSIVSLIGYIVFNISAEIYTGAIFLQQVLNWNLYLCVIIILLVTALYTTVGGLTSVIFTDTLQSAVLIISAAILFFISYISIGGYNGLQSSYMLAMANKTLSNQSQYSCGMPREDSFHIFRDPITADIPATGALLGLTIMGMYTWDNDQVYSGYTVGNRVFLATLAEPWKRSFPTIIVQRALSARNVLHAKAGVLLGGILKLTGFALFVIPGMISRVLFPDEIACADPDSCQRVCNNKAGCSNMAYPLLVLRVLPIGLRGLMLAALLAALMSSLTSILNSASSIVTMDLWRQFRRKANERELMIIGRITVLVLVIISILWLPILQKIQGGIFWVYFISIRAYLLPPLFMMFFLGVIWTRTTEQGVFWGLIASLGVGLVRLVLDFTYKAPLCGSGQADTRPTIVSKVEFLHFSTILSGFALFVMVSVSLFTEPRPKHKLHRVTWWTKQDDEKPELTSEEESDCDDDGIAMEEITAFQGNISSIKKQRNHKYKYNGNDTEPNRGALARIRASCVGWMCGTIDQSENKLTRHERLEIQRKMTSLHENPTWSTVINMFAVVVSMFVFFLFGVFH